MTSWTSEDLARIGDAEEVQIASLRRDGSLRKPVIVWVVRHGDDLYVRSVYGRDAAWFRGAGVLHRGRLRAGGSEDDVAFVEPAADAGLDDALDAAYRAKYRRYARSIVDSIVSAQARSATLRVEPRPAGS